MTAREPIRVTVLTDYRGAFWSSTRNASTLCTMNVSRLVSSLEERGCTVRVTSAGAVDLAEPARTPHFLLYTSSEESGGNYKRYLESRVFGMERRGYTPVPDLPFLYAHHDKVFMETLRTLLLGDDPGQPMSRSYGSLEDMMASPPQAPVVLKPAAGAGSHGVALGSSRGEIEKRARELSRSSGWLQGFRQRAKTVRRKDYVAPSLHLASFVVQEYVGGLAGDFKVLRYGERLYLISRGNRPNDFRASGSGLLNYRPHDRMDVTPVLDQAWSWSQSLGSPFVSMDVGYSPEIRAGEPVLIEFQCVSFGPAAIENSVGYFTGEPGGWHFVEDGSDFEDVFAEAAVQHFRQLL